MQLSNILRLIWIPIEFISDKSFGHAGQHPKWTHVRVNIERQNMILAG
jgi:hypothetical protein